MISTTAITAVLCTFLYFIKLRYFMCPVLSNNESVTPRSKPTVDSLIDVSIARKTLGQTNNFSDEKIHSVLWYRKPDWIDFPYLHTSLQNCQYRNCRFSNEKKKMKHHSAIVYTFAKGHLEKRLPLQTHERPRDQVWIFFYLESTLNLWKTTGIVPDAWRSTMNWSWSYRLDSDIINPYGLLTTKQRPRDRNYHKIYKNKTKFAAWVVSHCNADSNRDTIVRDLQTYGIPVDIYGKCGEMGKVNRSYLSNILNNDYKFYFAFENSLCPDYITEKFFLNFRHDIVLVVLGGANYNQLLPKNAFIDISNYKSTQELAHYLMKVSSSETLYSQYLREKDKYVVTKDPVRYNVCKLCEMLNHKEENVNVYENVNEYLYQRKYTCKECTETTSLTTYLIEVVFVYLLVWLTRKFALRIPFPREYKWMLVKRNINLECC